jgi:MoaD family protein
MKVNFYATLRQVTGARSATFDLPAGATVWQLLAAVVARYPEMGPQLLDDQGRLLGHVHLFVNGRDIPTLDDPNNALLSKDDKIDLFPSIGGG